MNDVIIRASDVTKVYRLYARPHYRFLDMIGLLRPGGERYTEHRALDGVNLEIRRGEKVAIIGRNGAGKSTFLKLATRVIEPTSGSIEVAEGVHALLQIGSGFHPEFSGRENARSYLAHLGITGRAAEERIREIVEFSELEEYIDQPIKTYSTGMQARLMFATSTAIVPKLLVLDEILGVGDAYFAQKSYDRIKELSEGEGTTVLLVSHDVYSAGKLCERMVWIDNGRIVIDGPSPTVMKAYEDSIRAQEAARLLKKNLLRLSYLREQSKDVRFLCLEFLSPNNLPLAAQVDFFKIELHVGPEVFAVPLGAQDGGSPGASHLHLDEGCWGAPGTEGDEPFRPMNDYGSPFRRATAVIAVPYGLKDLSSKFSEIRIGYRSPRPCPLTLRLHLDDVSVELGELPLSSGDRIEHCIDLPRDPGLQSKAEIAGPVNVEGIHGTGNVLVVGLRVLGNQGVPSFHLEHGREMVLEIDYEIRQPDLHEAADLLIGVHRDGVHDVCRFFTNSIIFDGRTQRAGTISMRVARLPLPNGKYTISLTLAKAGYYSNDPKVFYAINRDVYTCLSRFVEIQVYGGDLVASGTGLVEQAEWSDRARLEPAAP